MMVSEIERLAGAYVVGEANTLLQELFFCIAKRLVSGSAEGAVRAGICWSSYR